MIAGSTAEAAHGQYDSDRSSGDRGTGLDNQSEPVRIVIRAWCLYHVGKPRSLTGACPDARCLVGGHTGRVVSLSLRRCGAHVNQRQLIPGSYLTDGQRLFRVLSRLVNGRSTLVWIEDCLTLETRAYAASELGTTRWRPVRSAPVEARA